MLYLLNKKNHTETESTQTTEIETKSISVSTQITTLHTQTIQILHYFWWRGLSLFGEATPSNIDKKKGEGTAIHCRS